MWLCVEFLIMYRGYYILVFVFFTGCRKRYCWIVGEALGGFVAGRKEFERRLLLNVWSFSRIRYNLADAERDGAAAV